MPDSNMVVRAMATAEIVDEIWKEVARTHTDGSFSREAVEAAASATPVGAKAVPLGMPLPLPELLGLDGAAFIDAAYATLLGRHPDEAGAAYLAAELARGRDKTAVLGALQRSAEARDAGRRIAGLRRRALARAAYRLPVIGTLFRTLGTGLRRSGVSRRLAGSDQMGGFRADMTSRLAALGAELEQSRHAWERQAAAQQRTIELLTRRLAALHAAQEAATRKAAEDRLRWVEHAVKAGRDPTAIEDGLIGVSIALSEALRGQQDSRGPVGDAPVPRTV